MKKSLYALTAILAGTLSAGNMLPNASFENQSKGKIVPDAWTTLNNVPDRTFQSVEKVIVLDGKAAVRTGNTDISAAKGITHWLNRTPDKKLASIPAGTPMELSVYVFPLDKPADIHLFFESPADRASAIKNFHHVTPGKWTKLTVKFKHKAGKYAKSHVGLQLRGNGQVVFDCAYLGVEGKNPYSFDTAALEKISADIRGKLPKNANLIKNSSFEIQQEFKVFPEYWSTVNNVPSKTRQYQQNEIVLDGAVAARTDNTDPTAAKGIVHWIQKDFKAALANIPEGTMMELSAYFYAVDKPARIHFFFESPSAKTLAAKRATIKPGKWTPVTIRFHFKKGDYKSSHVALQLVGNGQAAFDCVYLGPAGSNPYTNIRIAKTPAELAANDYCRMLENNAGSRFLPGKVPAEVNLEMILPEKNLTVTLSEIDGKVIKTWKFNNIPVRKKHSLKIDIPQLHESAYELNYRSGNYNDSDCFRVAAPPAQGAYINADGFPVVDGKAFFPVGVCTPNNSPDAMRVYGQSGMNVIFSQSPLIPEFYDYMSEIAEKNNFYWLSWDSWGFRYLGGKNLKNMFLERRNMLRKHKRFMGFFSDEPMWQGIRLDSMRLTYKYMMRYLPEYISYINHAPRLTGAAGEDRHSRESGRRFTRACDLSSVDIYPFPEGHGHNNLPNRTLSCVGEYTDICREFTWNTRPVWMILQAWGWSETGNKKPNAIQPRPGKKEMRFMAWNAITHGAKGIIWYGHGAKDVYSQWYLQLTEVNFELAEMGKLIMASPIEYMKNLPQGVSGISGKGYKVFVNETKDTITVDGKPLAGQDVRIVTDKPLALPSVTSPFTEQPVKLSKDYGFDNVVALDADWICHPQYSSGVQRNIFARQSFNLDSIPKNAILNISVDDEAAIYINGKEIGTSDSYRLIQQFDIAKYLKQGENLIEFDIVNYAGPTALVFEVRADNKKIISSGTKTQMSLDSRDNFVPAKFVARHPKGTWGKPVMIQRMK